MMEKVRHWLKEQADVYFTAVLFILVGVLIGLLLAVKFGV